MYGRLTLTVLLDCTISLMAWDTVTFSICLLSQCVQFKSSRSINKYINVARIKLSGNQFVYVRVYKYLHFVIRALLFTVFFFNTLFKIASSD
jgi:hypothetical protein